MIEVKIHATPLNRAVKAHHSAKAPACAAFPAVFAVRFRCCDQSQSVHCRSEARIVKRPLQIQFYPQGDKTFEANRMGRRTMFAAVAKARM
jgi:hypothetical protein